MGHLVVTNFVMRAPIALMVICFVISGLKMTEAQAWPWGKPKVLDSSDCAKILTRKVFKPAKKPLEKMDLDFPLSARVETALLNLSNRDLDRVFSRFDLKTLQEAVTLMGLGQIKASPEEREFFEALLKFANKFPTGLWPKEGVPRRASINEAIEELKRNEATWYGESGAFGATFKEMLHGLSATDHAILLTIEGQGRKQGSAFKRYFAPLYKRVISISQATDFVMKEFSMVQDIDQIFNHALNTEWGKSLSKGTRAQLEESLKDTPLQLSSLQNLIAFIFGKKVVKGAGLSLSEIDLYELAENVRLSQLETNRNRARLGAVRDLDRLADEIEKGGQGESSIDPSQFQERGLQIRYDVRNWNRTNLFGVYRSALSLKPGVSYLDEWSETVCRTVTEGDGENQTTRQECHEEYHSERRYPDYEDIINDSYYVRGTATGLHQIRAEARGLAQQESSLKAPMESLLGWYDELPAMFEKSTIDPSLRNQLLSDTGQNLKVAEKMLQTVESYLAWSDDAPARITAQYRWDSRAHFVARNQALRNQYVNILRLLRATNEILSRSLPSLTPQFNLPNRDIQLAKLRRDYLWARGSQSLVALSAVSSLGWSQLDPQSFDAALKSVETRVSDLIDLFGGQ